MTRALVLAGGAAPYVDPWHPFAETSVALAAIAEAAGYEVEVATHVVERLADLSDVDLIIANVPSPETPLDADSLSRAQAGLDAFLARDGGVVALHVSVTTLLGLAGWSEAIGARWELGRTMHPPRGRFRVEVTGHDPLVDGLPDFDLNDELYSFMAFDGVHETLVQHEFDGVQHPLVWKRQSGPTRVVADALGHGIESYDSDEHKEILRRAFTWAADPQPSATTQQKE